MNLVYLAIDDVVRLEFKGTDIPIKPFSSFLSYTKDRVPAVGIIVDTDNEEKGMAVLKELRKTPETAAKPIFLTCSLGTVADHFSDGVMITVKEAYERAKSIHKLIDELVPDIFSPTESDVYRLLGFLYSRPDTSLIPIKHWTFEKLYAFPLVQTVLLDPADGTDQWLNNLKRRRLLRDAALIDRLRHCPKCNGVHLNFIDVCPSCTDLNISQKPFLHCFTCGNVAPEEKFLIRGGLNCPGCAARLRHIGTDYDRPLENYVCNRCDHTFIEPQVIARCQHCEAENKPEDLVPIQVHSLEITERGRMAVRSGSLMDVVELPDIHNSLDTSHFEFIVDWSLALCLRYPEERFSLIGIQLQNIIELTDKLGKYRVTELIDGFISRIRIDTTDLITRTGQYNFWILLPKTDSRGCDIVFKRLTEVKTDTMQEEDITLEFDAVTFSAPDDIQANEPANLLLSRLEREME
jgi:hypothetical protein